MGVETREASVIKAGAPSDGLGVVHFQVGEAFEERCEGHFGFRASEVRAETEVHAAAERQVLDVGTRDVEFVRVVENLGVPVRGALYGEQQIAFFYGYVADRSIFEGDARAAHLAGGFEAEELLDGVLRERRVGLELFELIRVAVEA